MTKMPRPERLTTVNAAEISLIALKGVTAISTAGDDLGVVDDVLMVDGNVDAVVLEIGGFAGIGGKKAGVKTQSLDLLVDPYDVHFLRLSVTREALKAGAHEHTASAVAN